jgi:Flp pilus assembly protein CpaB
MPTLARPALRPRRRLRRPLPYWTVVVAAAALPAMLVGRLAAEAAAERARWGPGTATVVVVVDRRAGEPVGDADVELRRLPGALRPRGALSFLPSAAVATDDLVAGEVLVASRLAPAGTSAVAARLPVGTRGIAVPNDVGLRLEVGDPVDVLATLDPGGGTGTPTTAVARDARVVDVGDRVVTVAVGVDEAERVAFALAAGVVTLALNGPRSR